MADSLKVAQDLFKINQNSLKVDQARAKILKDQVGLAQTMQSAIESVAPEELIDTLSEIQGALKSLGVDLSGVFDTVTSAVATATGLTSGFVESIRGIGEFLISPFTSLASTISAVGATVTNLSFAISKGLLLTAFLPLYPLIALVEELTSYFYDLAKTILGSVVDAGKSFLAVFGNAFKILIPVVGQLISSIFNIGKAMFTLPTMIFTNLLNMADDLFQKFIDIARAFEEVRKQLGDPSTGLNRIVRDLIGNMGGLDFFAGSRNLFTYFQDAGEAARFAAGLFSELGSVAESMGGQIADMGVDFIEFFRGMGLATEEVRGFAVKAITAGKPLEELLRDTANMSLQLADAFGMTGKLVGKDMAKMTKDVARFGTMTVREMGESAVFVRSLGLEVEALGKIVDKFLNFDSAVESTARLSQAFGANLDTLKLMKEANKGGAGAMEELRRGMFAAGRDAEKMNLAELRLLANTTGLSEEEAKLAFSMKNRGLTMDEVRKKAAKAGKQQLSQTEVMNKLADASERIVRNFGMSGSLLNRFFQGFQRGIKMNNSFINTLLNLRRVSEIVHLAGMEVGNAFIEAFPGIKDTLTFINKLFDPKVYKKAMGEVKGVFKTFFTSIGDPKTAKEAFGNLVNSLVGIFQKLPTYITGESGDAGKKAAKRFLMGISNTIAGAIRFLPDVVADLLNAVSNVLTTGKLGPGDPKGLLGSLFGEVSELVEPILDSLKAAFNNPKLRAALSRAGYTLMQFVWTNGLKPGLGFVIGKLVEGLENLRDIVIVKLVETFGFFVTRIVTLAFDLVGAFAMLPFRVGQHLKDLGERALVGIGKLAAAIVSLDFLEMHKIIGRGLYFVFITPFEQSLRNIGSFFTSGNMAYYIVNPFMKGLVNAFKSSPVASMIVDTLGFGDSFDKIISVIDKKQAELAKVNAKASQTTAKANQALAASPITSVGGETQTVEARLTKDTFGNLSYDGTLTSSLNNLLQIVVKLETDTLAKDLADTGILQGVAPK
jgi:hypothetical protein